MPSLWGLRLLPLGLSDTFIRSFNNVSLPHCVCVCVLMHLRTDFSSSYLLCVWGEVVIMLKRLGPSSGAVCLITVEQDPLISHCSPICLLQMSNPHTGPSIIFTSTLQLYMYHTLHTVICHIKICPNAYPHVQWIYGCIWHFDLLEIVLMLSRMKRRRMMMSFYDFDFS